MILWCDFPSRTRVRAPVERPPTNKTRQRELMTCILAAFSIINVFTGRLLAVTHLSTRVDFAYTVESMPLGGARRRGAHFGM